MKKILSLVLALLMMLGCAALAEDLTGAWYGDLFGMTATMTLAAEGTYTLELMGEADEGSWVLEGNTLYMDKGTEAEVSMVYDADTNTLNMDMEGMVIVFGREAAAAFVPAEPKADAAVEAFAGSWKASNVNFMDMLVPTDFAGMNMTLTIEGTTAVMALNMGEEEDDVATINGAFADGVLTLTIPAENEYSEDVNFIVKILQDGTMSCEFSMMGMPVIFYLDAVAAEVAPAA